MSQARDEAGNIWEIDAQGNAVRLIQAAPARPRGVVLQDPYKANDEARKDTGLDIERERLRVAQNGDRRAEATLPSDIEKARAEAERARAEAVIAQTTAAQGNTGKGLSPEVRAKALAQWAAATQLDATINELRSKFSAGPGATAPYSPGALKDFLPTVENNQFDKAAQGARGIVRNALGLTGGENNTEKESQMNLGPYVPKSSDYDASILDSISRLEGLRDNARRQAQSVLGGIPDANGQVRPAQQQRRDPMVLGTLPGQPPTPSPNSTGGAPGSGTGGGAVNQTTQYYANGAPGLDTVTTATGPTTRVIDPAREKAALALQRMMSNRATPESDIRSFALQNGATPASIEAQLKFRRDHPAYTGGYDASDLKFRQAPLSDYQRWVNPVASTPGGSALIGAANGVTFDSLDNMTSDPSMTRALMDANRRKNPVAAALGTVAGGALGAAGLESALGAGAARVGLGGSAWVSRAADAAYGAAAGAGSADGGDRLANALLGAVAGAGGGLVGRGAARGVGGAFTGVRNEAVRELRGRGVPLTVGQALSQSGMVGRTIKGVEDRLSGLPVIGDTVNARRLEGMQSFDRAAFDEALSPIGRNTGGAVGEPGVNAAQDAVSAGYRDALDGVNIPLDAQFGAELAAARAAGQAIPRTGPEFEHVVAGRIDPLLASGAMTGREMQDVMQSVRGADFGSDAMGTAASDAMRGVGGAVEGLLGRQAPGVLPAYQSANTAYRQTGILRDAVNAARNGGRSGASGIFAPSQLSDAAAANARRFGGTHGTTRQPFFDLSRAGQAVLPSSVPDSGTAGREVIAALLSTAGVAGAGAGAGYLSGDTQTGTGAGLATGAALALGGSRTGQRLLSALFADRPDALIRVGEQINRRAAIGGLLGTGASPLLTGQ